MRQEKQPLVKLSDYIKSETKNAEWTDIENIKIDSDWGSTNSAAARLNGLETLQEIGIEKVRLTNVTGVVEFIYEGEQVTFALNSGKHRRGGKWTDDCFTKRQKLNE